MLDARVHGSGDAEPARRLAADRAQFAICAARYTLDMDETHSRDATCALKDRGDQRVPSAG